MEGGISVVVHAARSHVGRAFLTSFPPPYSSLFTGVVSEIISVYRGKTDLCSVC